MRWRSSFSQFHEAPSFIEPCIPTKAARAPVGSDWLTEVKFDGYRLMIRKREDQVRVFTRRGADWTDSVPGVGRSIDQSRDHFFRSGRCLRKSPSPL